MSKILKARNIVFFAFLFSTHGLAQTENQPYRSVYELKTDNLSISVNLPDTITNVVNVDSQIKLELGKIFYHNYYAENISQTKILVKLNPGFQTTSEPQSAVILTNETDSLYIQYENGKFIKGSKFYLPNLINGNKTQNINGVRSQLFFYQRKDSMLVEVWFSKDLPFYVNPGICYKNLGGITKVQYYSKGQTWSIDLIPMDQYQNLLNIMSWILKEYRETLSFILFSRINSTLIKDWLLMKA